MGLLDTLLGNAGEKDVADLQDEFAPLMAPGETPQRAFALMRDLIVFTDRRVMFAALTPAGHAKLAEAAPDHVASVRKRFFKGLSHEQVQSLGEIFETMRANLTACPS